MDLNTGTVTSIFSQTRQSSDFTAFLEELMLKRYPEQNVILILDNASFHTGNASRAALALFEDRLRTLFLPSHTPELNPIERFWRHLKEKALGNHLCRTQGELEQRLKAILDIQNDTKNSDRFTMLD